MNTYYFYCIGPLAVGQIIEPNHYEELFHHFEPKRFDAYELYRELLVEEIRKRDFPDKPSRFISNILFQSLTDVRIFCREQASVGNFSDQDLTAIHVYTVSIRDSSKPQHLGCWAYLDLPATAPLKQEVPDFINKYWSGQKLLNRDDIVLGVPINAQAPQPYPSHILVESPIEILDLVQVGI